jgi:hypothetical protein
MFNSAAIKKKKSEKANVADKVKPSSLKGIDELISAKVPSSEKPKMKDLMGTESVKSSGVPSAGKPKSEDLIGIDIMLSNAKKKPSDKDDAYTKDKGYFEFDKEAQSEKLEKYKKKIKSRSEK